MEIVIIVLTIVSVVLFTILLDQGKGNGNKPHLPKAPAPKQEERPKDISEPVISFVKFLKENPENFLVKLEKREGVYDGRVFTYKLVDKTNRKVYVYRVSGISVYYPSYLSTRSVDFLTEDEKNYLLVAHQWGMKYIEEKKEAERKAKASVEREEYKKIYCKEK